MVDKKYLIKYIKNNISFIFYGVQYLYFIKGDVVEHDSSNYYKEHILFIKDVPRKKKFLNSSKMLYKIEPKYRHFTLYTQRVKELKKSFYSILNELRSASKRDILEIRINSKDSFIDEIEQIFNLIYEKFYGRTVAFLDNHASSIDTILFCMADKRVIYPYSNIKFYNYYNRLDNISTVKVDFLTNIFHDLIFKNGFFTDIEFKRLEKGEEYWMDAKEMCKREVATHVIYKGRKIKAKKYLKILSKKS